MSSGLKICPEEHSPGTQASAVCALQSAIREIKNSAGPSPAARASHPEAILAIFPGELRQQQASPLCVFQAVIFLLSGVGFPLSLFFLFLILLWRSLSFPKKSSIIFHLNLKELCSKNWYVFFPCTSDLLCPTIKWQDVVTFLGKKKFFFFY